MNRRQFVLTVAAASVACACGSSDHAHGAEASGPVDAGAITDYPRDGAYDKLAKEKRVMLIRQGDRLYATTATCTHRNCVLKSVGGDMRCGCHGSRFSLDGNVIKGPARDPLPRYAISSNNGRIAVDPSRKFDQKEWDNPASFVTVG
jgi:nitrite reductase/ring-hydroxylating ferredoxin subunit